jgi:hypothetical protein
VHPVTAAGPLRSGDPGEDPLTEHTTEVREGSRQGGHMLEYAWACLAFTHDLDGSWQLVDRVDPDHLVRNPYLDRVLTP